MRGLKPPPPSGSCNFAASQAAQILSNSITLIPVPCIRYTIHVYVRRALFVSLGLILLARPLLAADRPLLVCYGDSITAGHGLEAGQSFPDALQRDLDARGYHYQVSCRRSAGDSAVASRGGHRRVRRQ
jgi:hypothetical protein